MDRAYSAHSTSFCLKINYADSRNYKYGQGRSKVVPVLLTKHHAMKAYYGNGSTAPHILDLGTRWR
jgi:hypothetical protein